VVTTLVVVQVTQKVALRNLVLVELAVVELLDIQMEHQTQVAVQELGQVKTPIKAVMAVLV
jgi:hypothetical protein